MHRFFVSPAQLAEDEGELSGELHHQLTRVLRLAAGEEILLLDGAGLGCRCRIETLTKNVIRFRVLARAREAEPAFAVRLIQGLPKADKMDLILQKGTELGVAAFTPLEAGRSVPRLDEARRLARGRRWEKVVLEAARQCRRSYLPRLAAPCCLPEALVGDEELRLVLWEEESRPLAEVLPAVAPRGAAVLVGPEGGLEAREVEAARAAGFIPVAFGPRILRTETAGFAVIAILQYLYGDLGPAGKADLPALSSKEST